MPQLGRNRERKRYKGRGKILKNRTKENRIRQLDTRPLIMFSALSFTVLILITLLAALKNQTNAAKQPLGSNQPEVSIQPTLIPDNDKYAVQMVGVVTGVDAEEKKITLLNVQTDETISLEYTGASDIRSKYDKVIAGAQLNLGDMADVTYQGVTKTVLSLKVNAVGWEYNTVSNLLIDTDRQMMSFLGNRYTYSDGLLLLNNGTKTSLGNLVKSDVLTIRGYEEKVCSIQVTRGHGYLKLTEDEDFIGGTIEVGMLMSKQIQKGMILTVPEGSYDIRISNRQYSGEERITIKRDQTSTLRADAYGPTGVQKGRVTFQVIPEEAVLTIDGERTFFAIPVELSYGEHEVEAALGGYHSYKGTVTVDKTESRFRIILSENTGNSESEEDETEQDPDFEDETDDWNNDNDNDDDWTDDDWTDDDWTDDDWNDNDDDDDDWTDDDDSEDEPQISTTPNQDEEGDNTSESSGNLSGTDSAHTLTIRCSNGVKVYVNGIYAGEIENGEVVLPKYLGQLELTLMLNNDVKHYTIEVFNDKKDTSFTFPNF